MLDIAKLTYELRELVTLITDELRERATADPSVLDGLKVDHRRLVSTGRSTGQTDVTQEVQLAQIAVAWVLGAVFVRFAEDNRLVELPFIGGRHGHEHAVARHADYLRAHPEQNDGDWLLAAFDHLANCHPILAQVFSRQHNPLWLATPSPTASTTLLEFWRRRNTDGSLVHDLSDAELGTQFLAALYQGLSELARKTYALIPTPEFVTDHILDLTLRPALEKIELGDLRVVDPACGSGGFVLGAFERLTQQWAMRAPGLPSEQRIGLALAAVHGVDLNPFAVSVTRFRMLAAAVRAVGYTTFEAAKGANWQLSIAVGDSLLGGSPAPPSTEDLGDYPTILEPGSYDVVVCNPPYLTVKDRALDHSYRAHYDACAGAYSLVVPFSQLVFHLARPSGETGTAGYIGLLTANSFMKRQFGRKLIENFYAKSATLTHIIDTSGAYIPGHGTPTVILAGRNQPPRATDPVLTVHGLRGEPAVPSSPAEGKVWRSIVEASQNPGHTSRWAESLRLPQDAFGKFPWNLGGRGAADLVEAMSAGSRTLSDVATRIGYFANTGSDDIFTGPPGTFRRAGAETGPVIVDVLTGSEVRDWVAIPEAESFFPRNDQLNPIDLRNYPGHARRLWPFRTLLEQRPNYSSGSYLQAGRAWYDWHQVSGAPKDDPRSITFSWVATHNHFALLRDRVAPLNSAPVVEFDDSQSEEDLVRLTAILNSSAACFWLKQHSQGKGRPRVDQTGSGDPWTEVYEFTASQLQGIPLPEQLPTWRASELDRLAHERVGLTPENVTPTRGALASARRAWELLGSKMISLQEELDWEVYYDYGLVDTEDLMLPDAPPPIKVGERAFEIVLARKSAMGEITTTWFSSSGAAPVISLPMNWPGAYRELVERRIAAIERWPHLAILESPEFKRRWATDSWERKQRNAVGHRLLDLCEEPELWFDDGRPRLRTRHEIVTRLTRIPAATEAIAAYAPDLSPAAVITELLGDNEVPGAAALRYRDSGLQKHDRWKQIWAAQRSTDLARARDDGELNNSIGKAGYLPPKFTSADFRKASYWRQRGKLDVPNERFISYPGKDSEPYFGWAGWDHAQRAEALGHLIEEGSDGSTNSIPAPVSLLAGLQELLPWLVQWHKAAAPRWTSLWDRELDRHGLTEEDVARWQPPAPRRGRPPKAKS